MDEIELLRAAASNANAFAELYRLHVTRVYRYHMAHVGSARGAEDLTSQTFMTALEEFHSFRRSDLFAAWLMRIAAQKRLNDIRGNRQELPTDAVLYYQSSGLPTDRVAMQRKEIEETTRALKQISPDHAEAIILTFFSDLSSSEASRVLKKSTATTQMLISRGIQELRTHSTLAPDGAEDHGTFHSDPEDERLAGKLTHNASQITPDSHFIVELEKALETNHLPKTKWTFSLQQIVSLAGWALLIATGVFLLNWRDTPNPAPIKPVITSTSKADSTAVPEVVIKKVTVIPRPSPTVRATVTRLPTLKYIVQAGDTCTYIADQFGVTISQLIILNKLNDACDILIGETLVVPIIATSTPSN